MIGKGCGMVLTRLPESQNDFESLIQKIVNICNVDRIERKKMCREFSVNKFDLKTNINTLIKYMEEW